MANPWTQFLNLLPDQNRWIGKVMNNDATDGKITVSVPGSSATGIVVNTDETYDTNSYVFIEGSTVVSKAPNLASLSIVEISG